MLEVEEELENHLLQLEQEEQVEVDQELMEMEIQEQLTLVVEAEQVVMNQLQEAQAVQVS